jgi:hypothetical protein
MNQLSPRYSIALIQSHATDGCFSSSGAGPPPRTTRSTLPLPLGGGSKGRDEKPHQPACTVAAKYINVVPEMCGDANRCLI